MKICPNCKNECQEQAAFCTNCGYAFPKNTPIMEMKTETPHPAASQPPSPQGEGVGAQPQGEGTGASASAGMPVYQAHDAAPSGVPGEIPVGTPVQELYTPAAPPKKKKKAVLIAAISLAVIALGIGAFFLIRAIIARANPDGADFIEIQREYLAERFDAEALPERVRTAEHFSKDITLSAELSGNHQEVQQIQKILDGSAVVFKMDTAPGRVLINMVLNLKGSNILEAILQMTETEITFSFPALDDRSFVLDVQKMEEEIGEGYSQIIGAIGSATEATSEEDIRTLGRTLRDLLAEHITEESLKKEDAENVRLEGLNVTVSGRLLTWKPTAEEAEKLMLAFADFLEKDETLHRVLDSSGFGSLAAAGGDSFSAQLKESAAEIRKNAKDAAKRLTEEGFAWSVLTDADGKLARIRVEQAQTAVFYETAADGAATRKEAFLVTDKGVRQVALMHDYSDNGDLRSGTYDLSTAGGSVLIRFETDRSKRSAFGGFYGWWEADLTNLVPSLKLRAEITEENGSDSVLTVSVSGLGSYTGGAFESGKLTFRVKEGSTAKEPAGTRTDISDYSSQQMEALMQQMANNLLLAILDSPELMEILAGFYF